METSVNNKCRAFTSLEQSKKLAEILPLESADMHYCLEQRDIASGYEIGITPYTKAKSFIGKCNIIDVQPSWSLASLLNIIPTMIGSVFEKDALRLRIDKSETNFNIWYDNLDTGMVEEDFDVIKTNPVDACYEMILKLKERNLL